MSDDDHRTDPETDRLETQAASGCAESRMLLTRRQLMGVTAGLFSWAHMPTWAEAATVADPRLLVVVLRGGMDGINTVVPHGDPAYEAMRRDVAFAPGSTVDLDGYFGLHPSMPNFARMYGEGEAAVVHAVCTPLRNRSHFDAQDNLENGLPGLASNTTGWLNRLLTALPAGAPIKTRGAIEIGEAPLILRGPAPVLGWSPTWFQPFDGAARASLRSLYGAQDPAMLRALDLGLAARQLASGHASDDGLGTLRKGFRGAGRLLAEPAGPRIAVLSVDGFDTHSRQGVLTGTLAGLLSTLDTALEDFRGTVGAAWSQTVVLCVTEFGRSVRANGDGGTDHGVGTVALLAGGAVDGGKVVCDWPGIGSNQLYDGGDLRPTTDLRAVFKGVLREHLDVPDTILERQVFPSSAAVRPLSGLVRTPASASSALALAAGRRFGNDAPSRPVSALARYRERYG